MEKTAIGRHQLAPVQTHRTGEKMKKYEVTKDVPQTNNTKMGGSHYTDGCAIAITHMAA